ncbi:sigma-70 family RNA polymerase sigma factor, partial [Streptomyces cinereoruber]
LTTLHPLLTAEPSAEAHATGTEPGDLEQAVWLRLLERLATDGPPRQQTRQSRTEEHPCRPRA